MNSDPLILRVRDIYTGRSATLRLEQRDGQCSVRQLFDKYLHQFSGESFLDAGAITSESMADLQALQDLVYACDDQGRLTTMYSGVSFQQDGNPVALNETPLRRETRVGDLTAEIIDLAVDRTNVGYERNWTGFHRRRWANDSLLFSSFVLETLESELGQERAENVMALDTQARKLAFVRILARRIWDSEFENYSRFIVDKLMFKTGDETVKNIASGCGGICTEKVQALKFLTDHFGLESEYLIGGDGARDPVPVDRLREMLRTFDFRFARRHMRYWQHAALLYNFDGVPVLVDATNGNIPFLFLAGDSAERLLGYEDKSFVKVRMVEAEEDYYYHRVPQDIPQDLFFAMEGWITDTDMVQVFENELGLFLSSDYYVTPLLFRNDQEYERLAADYLAIARRAGFRCHVSRLWDFDGELGQEFARAYPSTACKILAAKEHLLLRYNEWDVPGHDAGLVLFGLT